MVKIILAILLVIGVPLLLGYSLFLWSRLRQGNE